MRLASPAVRHFAAVPVCLAALALPAGAAAAPPWSAPATAQPSGVAASASTPGLALARDGGVVAFSTTEDPTRPAAARRGRQARLAQSGLGSTRSFPAGRDLAAPAQAYAATRTLLLTQRRTGGTDGFPTVRLGVTFGRVTGALDGSSQVLDERVGLRSPAVLATNARGDAAAAWVESYGGGRTRLWVALRRPGRRFGRASVIVGTGSLSAPAVGVGARGDVVVAFQRTVDGEQRVAARMRRAGHSFGKIDDFGPSAGIADIDAAVARSGRAVVAWKTFDGGEEVNLPTQVYAAVKPAGPRRFRTAQQLDPGDARNGTPGTVAVATADDDGTATVGWSARTGSGSAAILPVRFATTDARAVFGEAQDLPGASGALRDVAVADDGTAAIAWSARGAAVFEAGGLTAAVRPASALAFGPAELVSADPAESTGTADLAFAPQSTRLAVAWLAEERQFRFGVRVSRRG